MTERPEDSAHRGSHELYEAVDLLDAAVRNPRSARPAALAALRALLLYWDQDPRGDTVVELLNQVAETDDTLLEFSADAAALDGGGPGDLYAHAKVFVDAARGRIINI